MRPQKTTVDYFPHRTTSGKTISILENLYGNNGYAAWFKILEILGATPGHFYDFSTPFGLQFLAAKIGVSVPETQAVLHTCAELDAIDPDLHSKGIIWSQNFVDGLEYVYSKRGKNAPTKPSFCDRKPTTSDVSVPENRVSVTESARREGKGIKGNRIEDNLKIIRRSGFENFDLGTVDERISIEVIEAFIDHRKKIRKPLTPYALSLVCKDASKVYEQYEIHPNDAIKHIIAMGWQGCNPKYFEPKNGSRTGNPQKTARQQYMDDLGNFLEAVDDGTAIGGCTTSVVETGKPLSRGGIQRKDHRSIGG